MDSNIPSEIASTIQAASLKRHPSPRHDLNPSTAASQKQPVTLDEHPDPDASSNVGEDEIPISVLNPVPRRNTMPPLPDLRFEQSYLKSIEQAQGWQGVLWITLRDQVIMCFAQGVLWTLVLNGWRHWNRSAKFSGQSVGAKIRRWWWGVNNWTIPNAKSRLRDTKLAKNVSEYYEGEFSSAAQD
ncbi:Nn.00g009030.m01.CDS01 [Neocucurbitaria sp. VM-36]